MTERENEKTQKAGAPIPKKCFVIGPIGAEASDARRKADWLLDGIIMPVFAAHFSEFEVTRSDKINQPGMIDVQMINLLYEAELVIADMTGQNANAFYEMGIRHVVGLPIIHMFEVGTEIPFDVKPHRAIPYSLTEFRDLETARLSLKKNVEETLKAGFQPDNPVTRARGVQHIREHSTPEAKVFLDEMLALKGRVSQLEQHSSPAAELASQGRSKIFRDAGGKVPDPRHLGNQIIIVKLNMPVEAGKAVQRMTEIAIQNLGLSLVTLDTTHNVFRVQSVAPPGQGAFSDFEKEVLSEFPVQSISVEVDG